MQKLELLRQKGKEILLGKKPKQIRKTNSNSKTRIIQAEIGLQIYLAC